MLQTIRNSSCIVFMLSFAFYSTFANSASSTSETVNNLAPPNLEFDYTIKQGDNLFLVFKRLGLSAKEAFEINNATKKLDIFKKIIPGETLSFQLDTKKLDTLTYYKRASDPIIISKVAKSNRFTLLPVKIDKEPSLQNLDKKLIGILSNSKKTSGSLSNKSNIKGLVVNSSKLSNDAFPGSKRYSVPLSSVVNIKSNANDNLIYYTVQANDNLTKIFIRAGLNLSDVFTIVNDEQGKLLNNLQIQQRLGLLIRAGHLVRLEYEISKLKTIVFSRVSELKYNINTYARTPVKKLKYAAGIINSSFFVDAINAGLSNNEAMNFTIPFRWDVDFSQDIQPGDQFKAIYQNNTVDGELISTSQVLIAELSTQGQTHTGIFFTDSKGEDGYYTPEGRLMRKSFLRMPVEFARISSKFSLTRKHPILNTIRAHKGVDYAAKTGTPIMAAGSGKIISIGRKGDYGKAIIIQHDSRTTTLYAHMTRFNKNLKVGSKVAQKQIIGYVGSTGASTGPHLHYEFRVNGVHKNPLTVKLPKALILQPLDLKAFRTIAKKALKQLKDFNQEKLASNATDTKI